MNIITKLKKDETPSQKLSKHFERIFNTKETFIFDLENQNSKAFILLKDGKVVLESYFNGFSQDSFWYWASAGKH